MIAAGTTIAQTDIPTGEQIGALAVFIVIASLTTAVPVGMFLVTGDRAKPRLDEIKGWLSTNNNVIMAAILLVIGVKLLGDGISGLSL